MDRILAGPDPYAPVPLWGFELGRERAVLAERAGDGYRVFVPTNAQLELRELGGAVVRPPKLQQQIGDRPYLLLKSGSELTLTTGAMSLRVAVQVPAHSRQKAPRPKVRSQRPRGLARVAVLGAALGFVVVAGFRISTGLVESAPRPSWTRALDRALGAQGSQAPAAKPNAQVTRRAEPAAKSAGSVEQPLKATTRKSGGALTQEKRRGEKRLSPAKRRAAAKRYAEAKQAEAAQRLAAAKRRAELRARVQAQADEVFDEPLPEAGSQRKLETRRADAEASPKAPERGARAQAGVDAEASPKVPERGARAQAEVDAEASPKGGERGARAEGEAAPKPAARVEQAVAKVEEEEAEAPERGSGEESAEKQAKAAVGVAKVDRSRLDAEWAAPEPRATAAAAPRPAAVAPPVPVAASPRAPAAPAQPARAPAPVAEPKLMMLQVERQRSRERSAYAASMLHKGKIELAPSPTPDFEERGESQERRTKLLGAIFQLNADDAASGEEAP